MSSLEPPKPDLVIGLVHALTGRSAIGLGRSGPHDRASECSDRPYQGSDKGGSCNINQSINQSCKGVAGGSVPPETYDRESRPCLVFRASKTGFFRGLVHALIGLTAIGLGRSGPF